MNFLLLNSEMELWEKLMGGSTGFILATVLYGVFHWKVVMPQRAKETAELTRLADAVNAIVLQNTQDSEEKFERIIEILVKKP